jgi:RNA polymerase primary sigma factor
MLKRRRSDESDDEIGLSRLFMIALRTGSTTAVRAFLGRKAALAGTDSRGRSPLLIASSHGHLPICELLLEAGSDPFAIDSEGLDGREHARRAGREDIVSLIASAQAAQSAKAVEIATAPSTVFDEPDDKIETASKASANAPDVAHSPSAYAASDLEKVPASIGAVEPTWTADAAPVSFDWNMEDDPPALGDMSPPNGSDFQVIPSISDIHDPAVPGQGTAYQIAPPNDEPGPVQSVVEHRSALATGDEDRSRYLVDKTPVADEDFAWEVDTSTLNDKDDRSAIQAAAEAQQRLSVIRPRNLDGDDWSSIEIDLPEPRETRAESPLPRAVITAAREALQRAQAAGEYSENLFSITGLFTAGQERVLRRVLRATAATSGCIVDRETDLWAELLSSDPQVDQRSDDVSEFVEHFTTSCWVLGRPTSYDMQLNSYPRLSRNEEANLFRKVSQAMAEAMLEIAKSRDAIDFILAADDRVEDGLLPVSFVSSHQFDEADDEELESRDDDTDDDVISDDQSSNFIELPPGYVSAVIELRNARAHHGNTMLPSEVRRASRALNDMGLTSDFMRYLAIELPIREGHTRTMDGAFSALARSEKAKRLLLERHLPHVRAFAQRYAGRGLDLDDVIQEGNIGLMRAIQTFDTSRGHRFWTYAQAWVWQRITRGIADLGDAIRLPIHAQQERRRMEAAIDTMVETSRGGFDIAQVAVASSLPIKLVERFLAIRSVESLEDQRDLLNDEVAGALIVDTTGGNPLENALLGDLAGVVMESLTELPDRIQDIIRLRFGLDERGDHTLEEIGQMYGVTRERIRQIESKGLKALAHPSRTRALRTLLDS